MKRRARSIIVWATLLVLITGAAAMISRQFGAIWGLPIGLALIAIWSQFAATYYGVHLARVFTVRDDTEPARSLTNAHQIRRVVAPPNHSPDEQMLSRLPHALKRVENDPERVIAIANRAFPRDVQVPMARNATALDQWTSIVDVAQRWNVRQELAREIRLSLSCDEELDKLLQAWVVG